MFQVAQLGAGLDEVSNVLNGALDSPGNLIDILRLDNSLEIVLQNLGEVVCVQLEVCLARLQGTLYTYSAVRNHGST